MNEIRWIRVDDNLTVCQLLPVEGFLLWALRAWCCHQTQASDAAHLMRWRIRGAFQRFGVITQFADFDGGMSRMTSAPPSGTPDFHNLDCLCVGQDERRWLHTLGALQRGSRETAADCLAKVISAERVPSVLEAFDPLTQALSAIGWRLPPWQEAHEVASPAMSRSRRTPLRLVVSQADPITAA